MKRLSVVLAVALLIVCPVAGLEITEAYVESFLDSLPYGLVYWTRNEAARVRIPPSFSTVQIAEEDGTASYALQVTRLAAATRPGKLSYGDSLTQYFYLIPAADEALKLYDPSGREIPLGVTGKPIAPSEEAIREMQSAISEFAQLTARYRSLQRDDSGEQFWSWLGLSIVMSGLTGLSVYGAVTEQPPDALYAGASAVGCGLLAGFSVALAIGNLRDYRRQIKELREIEDRLERINIARADG
jgi:hypothetical protein